MHGCYIILGLFSPDFQCFSANVKLFFSGVTVFFQVTAESEQKTFVYQGHIHSKDFGKFNLARQGGFKKKRANKKDTALKFLPKRFRYGSEKKHRKYENGCSGRNHEWC